MPSTYHFIQQLLGINEEQTYLFIMWILMVPLACITRQFPPKKAKYFACAAGTLFCLLYLGMAQFTVLIALCLVNYLIALRLKKSQSHYVVWQSLAFCLVSYSLVYLYLADFRLTAYVYQIPVCYTFIIQRIVSFVHYYSRNPGLIEQELTLKNFLLYILSYFGLVTGPFFDYENFRTIFSGAKFKKTDDAVIVYSKRFLLASLIYIGLQHAVGNERYPWLSALDRYTFIPSDIFKKIYILMISLYTLLAQIILGYDLGLFLLPDRKKEPTGSKSYPAYAINPLFYSSSFRQDLSEWNIAVVQWLGMIYRGHVSPKLLPLLSLFTSSLWHGPSLNYFITLILTIIALLVNKMWFKLRTQKKFFQFINPYTETVAYYVLCCSLNGYVASAAAMPFFTVDLDTILIRAASVYYVPYFGIIGAYFGLKWLNDVLE